MNAESIHISRNVEICQKNSGLAYMVFLDSKAKSFTLNQTMEFFSLYKETSKDRKCLYNQWRQTCKTTGAAALPKMFEFIK